MRHWDWDGMVEANRGRLIGLLAGLFAMLGTGEVVPRLLKRAVLARLLPMEASLRRLIFVMARDLPVVTGAVRTSGGAHGKEKKDRAPVFRLTDMPRIPDPKPPTCPRRREPRIRSLDEREPAPEFPLPVDDDAVDTGALRRRMTAMEAALVDLSKQAQRLARWYARRDRMRAAGVFSRLYPIRTGRAPGHVKGGRRDVDDLLANCHDLALRARAMVEAERAAAR